MSSILKGLMTEKNKINLENVREDSQRSDELQYAFQQAKNITSQIKNDRTVNEILTNIELLVNKYNIDRDAFEVAEAEVKNAQQQLAAAIYGLDQIFQDAMKNSQYDNQEVEEGQIYSTGGGAGQSQRIYKPKPAGLRETEAVNKNNDRGWRWTNIKPAGI